MRRIVLLAAGLALALTAGQGALAHKGAKGVIKERMKLMMRMEKRLKPVMRMVQGRAAFDAAEVHERGRQLYEMARRLPQLFPEGSARPPSEASPAIWRQFDDFRHKAKEMEAAAMLLMEASAPTLPQIAQQVQATCKGCHERYRVEKD